MNILEELYYGNINISERDVKEGSDEQAALSAASDAQIKLMDALPDDLKPLLNNLNAANDSLLDATSREMFEQGFQYGNPLGTTIILNASKTQGKYTGRKPIVIDWTKFGLLYGEWKSKNITGRDFMRRMGLSANTFYRRVREYEAEHGIAEPTSA